MIRKQLINVCHDVANTIGVIRQSDTGVAADAIIEVVIAHIRRDRTIPARPHRAWWLAFANARGDIEAEIKELIDERLDETIVAIADEVDDDRYQREIAMLEEVLFQQSLKAIAVLEKLHEVRAAGSKHARATRAGSLEIIRPIVDTLRKIKAKREGEPKSVGKAEARSAK
jgi:hypothetical protein